NRIWEKALLDRGPRDVEIEVLPTVRHVEEYSATPRLSDGRFDLPGIIENSVAARVKKVADDVARAEKLENRFQRRHRIRHMDHPPKAAGELSGFDRTAQRLKPRLADHLSAEPGFDPQHQIRVLTGDRHDRVHIRIGQVIELAN